MNKEFDTNKDHDVFYSLIEKAKEIKLTDKEKTALFSAVDTFIKRNPLSTKAGSVPLSSVDRKFAIKSPFADFQWSIFHSYGFRTVIALLVVGIVGTGTSFAAQGALPGDFLYPIKVNFNEEIKAALLTGKNQVEYEATRTKNRVDEVKKLAVQNKLSNEIKGKVTTQINSHIAKVQKDLDTLSKEGDFKTVFEISTDLEKSLANSEAEVATLDNNEVTHEQVEVVKAIIQDSKETAAETRESAEDQIFALNANADDIKTIALAKFDTVKASLEKLEAQADLSAEATMLAKTEAVTEVETNLKKNTLLAKGAPVASKNTEQKLMATEMPKTPLEQAEELFKDGEEKLSAGEYAEAFKLLRAAGLIVESIEKKDL